MKMVMNFSVKSKEFLIELLDKFTEPNVLEMRRDTGIKCLIDISYGL